ncbi:MAG TPA: acylphosphatase, partial [Rhodothermales bacterium]|nr:acylphosphatase [Rhodothermales bacterium]
MPADLARVEAVVHGRVQGVNFRAFVAREARDLGLLGWVRNEPDGTVRLVAEGPKAKIERLLEAVHVGPPLSRV